jgi:uncharacterized protein (TIGR02145 family)
MFVLPPGTLISVFFIYLRFRARDPVVLLTEGDHGLCLLLLNETELKPEWMRTGGLLLVMTLALMPDAFSQKTKLGLTFTALNNTACVRLDSVRIMNRSQGGETLICWPDTTASLTISPGDTLLYVGYSTGYPIGIQEIQAGKQSFQLARNYPNPIEDWGIIRIFIPATGKVDVRITDVRGQVVCNSSWQLAKGNHSFRFTPGDGPLCFLTASWNGESRTIKILSAKPENGGGCTLEYIGDTGGSLSSNAPEPKSERAVLESGILDHPQTNTTYTFQFASNIPCPGTPAVVYEGTTYHTIQIFSQCWLKENLNTGTLVSAGHNQTNDGIIEKYCIMDNLDSCMKFGGLYQWDEMMQYSLTEGAQGICPPGWHVPAEEEWKILEGCADSYYSIGDEIWESGGYRGYDAGKNLKTTGGWELGGNGTDLFGFSAIPGGFRDHSTSIVDYGIYGYWWTSREQDTYNADYRAISFGDPGVDHSGTVFGKDYGFSVRCLRDN